jgi:hypothetical protein
VKRTFATGLVSVTIAAIVITAVFWKTSRPRMGGRPPGTTDIRIERLFANGARWNGKVVYQRGYGMGSLELGVPITPSHVFPAESIRAGHQLRRCGYAKPHHLPAGLFPSSANASTILSAIDGVPAKETFDITATAKPRSGTVRRDDTSSTQKWPLWPAAWT